MLVVNSDLDKTKIVTFALKIINSKSVSKTTFTRGEFAGKYGKGQKFTCIRLLCLDVIRRSSNKKELIWIKTDTKRGWIKFYSVKFLS